MLERITKNLKTTSVGVGAAIVTLVSVFVDVSPDIQKYITYGLGTLAFVLGLFSKED